MSRFVSAGTADEPTERDEAWRTAQAALDARALAAKEAARGTGGGGQEGGKTLYETLQANKAAKQEAHEESLRLRNQFRSLDEDEVEFLEGVGEAERAEEMEVKRRTREELESFRRMQEEAEKREGAGVGEVGEVGKGGEEESVDWAAGRKKRKRGKGEGVVGGLKNRRTSTTEKKEEEGGAAVHKKDGDDSAQIQEPEDKQNGSTLAGVTSPSKTAENGASQVSKPATVPAKAAAAPSGLGLAAYSSDEDD